MIMIEATTVPTVVIGIGNSKKISKNLKTPNSLYDYIITKKSKNMIIFKTASKPDSFWNRSCFSFGPAKKCVNFL